MRIRENTAKIGFSTWEIGPKTRISQYRADYRAEKHEFSNAKSLKIAENR